MSVYPRKLSAYWSYDSTDVSFLEPLQPIETDPRKCLQAVVEGNVRESKERVKMQSTGFDLEVL